MSLDLRLQLLLHYKHGHAVPERLRGDIKARVLVVVGEADLAPVRHSRAHCDEPLLRARPHRRMVPVVDDNNRWRRQVLPVPCYRLRMRLMVVGTIVPGSASQMTGNILKVATHMWQRDHEGSCTLSH
jgi:hypothetical protein